MVLTLFGVFATLGFGLSPKLGAAPGPPKTPNVGKLAGAAWMLCSCRWGIPPDDVFQGNFFVKKPVEANRRPWSRGLMPTFNPRQIANVQPYASRHLMQG